MDPIPKDRDILDLLDLMLGVLKKHPHAKFYLKWTCPQCGERVAADKPNVYCEEGYIHTECKDGSRCGAHYTGRLYGLRLIFGRGEEELGLPCDLLNAYSKRDESPVAADAAGSEALSQGAAGVADVYRVFAAFVEDHRCAAVLAREYRAAVATTR